MDKKILEKIKEILKEAKDCDVKILTQNEDRTKHALVLHGFESLKFHLANDLSKKDYSQILNTTLLLAMGFMYCVGSKIDGEEEATKSNIAGFKAIYKDCLELIESLNVEECEHCKEDE